MSGAEGVEVRAIEPGDKEGLVRSFERLSSESRYRRFFSPKSRLSSGEVHYLTEVDHSDHEALVAVDRADGAILGVARYVRVEPPEHAEVAVTVADDWHGRGVASGLLVRLVGRARENGITHFVAVILSDNEAALSLFGALSDVEPRRERTPEGHVELLIELPAYDTLAGTGLGDLLRQAATEELPVVPGGLAGEKNRPTR